jgi:hypothetical protein
MCADPKQPKPRPASGFYGVSAFEKRWHSRIRYDSTQHHLGTFDTKQEAALAYDREARQCGKEKLLNYESIKAAEDAAVQSQAEHILVHEMCAGPKPRPPSGFYGVCADRKRWRAKINYDGKVHHLGSFDTKQEAALAYDREARQCGEDKLLNYESIKAAEDAAVQAQAEHILVHDMCASPLQPKPLPLPASGFYGVSANGKRWQAKITYNRMQHNLGTFDTKQEAALAYDREARQCGEDKPLNYENIKAAEEAAAQAQAEHIVVHDMCAGWGPKQPKPRPPSGFYGVYPTKKRWAAQITYGGRQHSLGYFDTKQEAALAYDKAARQCGEDKLLNYESIQAAEEAAAQAQAAQIMVNPQQPKPRPASGFYGVYANTNKWMTQIYYDGKLCYLGTFYTKQEAALAYDRAARQCGEDKLLNYESIKAAEEATVQAQVEHMGYHSLGYFGTRQEAALAYDRAARQCGEDKLLNFESIKAAEAAQAQSEICR